MSVQARRPPFSRLQARPEDGHIQAPGATTCLSALRDSGLGMATVAMATFTLAQTRLSLALAAIASASQEQQRRRHRRHQLHCRSPALMHARGTASIPASAILFKYKVLNMLACDAQLRLQAYVPIQPNTIDSATLGAGSVKAGETLWLPHMAAKEISAVLTRRSRATRRQQ